jgi:hypothetical protein
MLFKKVFGCAKTLYQDNIGFIDHLKNAVLILIKNKHTYLCNLFILPYLKLSFMHIGYDF